MPRGVVLPSTFTHTHTHINNMPSTTTINASDGTLTPLPLFAHLKYLFLHPFSRL